MKQYAIYKFSFIPLLLILLPSCFVAKDYARPELVDEASYRMHQGRGDSLNMATLSWREIFVDPNLQDYIEEGLEKNLDIRVALEQINAANAYFKQGRAAFFPSLNSGAQASHQQLARNSQLGSIYDGSLTQFELTGSLSWEADIWGKIRSQSKANQATYFQTIAAHQAVKTRLVSSIASLYYQLLA